MKAESTEKVPKFNLLKPDGIRSQAHNEVVTRVLLNDGQWYDITPGSFKFYKVSSANGVPYVQFDYFSGRDSAGRPINLTRVEVFPASVCGIGYPAPVVDTDVVTDVSDEELAEVDGIDV